MKNINVKVEDDILLALNDIQEYYSKKFGVKLSQRQTLSRLLIETSNLIKNTGETYSNRNWIFELQDEKMIRGKK